MTNKKMKDENKSKAELIAELNAARQRIAELETRPKNGAPGPKSRFWEALFEQIPFDLWVRDHNLNLITQSEASLACWGALPDPNIEGQRWPSKALADEDQPTKLERMVAGEAINAEVAMNLPSGETRYVKRILTPIYHAEAFQGLLGINIDLTQHKRLEELLQRRLDFIRFTSQIATELIAIQPNNMASALEQVLHLMCQFASFEWGCIFLVNPAKTQLNLKQEWSSAKMSPHAKSHHLHQLALADLPASLREPPARTWQTFHRASLPTEPDYGLLHQLLTETGTQTLALAPLHSNDTWLGYVGFAYLEQSQSWSEEMQSSFQLALQVIANALHRQRTDAALQHTTSELEALFQAYPDWQFRLDATNTVLTYQTGQTSLQLGVTENFLNQDFLAHFPAPLAEALGKAIQKTRLTQNARHLYYSLPCSSDSSTSATPYTAKTAGALLRDEDENVHHYFEARILSLPKQNIMVIIRDISEQVAADLALQESEERFQATFEQAPVGIAHTTLKGKMIRVNNRLADMLGYTPQALLKKSIKDLSHPEDWPREVAFGRTLATGQVDNFTMEKRYIRQDGSLMWGQLTVWIVRNREGDFKYVVGAVEDISARKAAEAELTAIKQRYQMAVEASRTGVWDWQPEQQGFYIDPHLKELLGYSDAEINNTLADWLARVHPKDRTHFEEALRRTSLEKPQMEYIHRCLDKAGRVHWLLGRGTAMPAKNGDMRLIGTYTDITERMKIETRLQQQNLELGLINRMSQVFSSTLNLDEVLRNLLNEVRHLLDATACAVWLTEPGSQHLVCAQAVNTAGGWGVGQRLAYGKGIVGWVKQHGQTQVVNQLSEDPRYRKLEQIDYENQLNSMIAAPLRIGHPEFGSHAKAKSPTSTPQSQVHVIGVLQVVDTEAKRFTQREASLLESLATTAAIAVENARLYHQTVEDAKTKSMLLEEVNHRVKNNLAAILGLLYAESEHTGLAEHSLYRRIMKNLINRIQGLATVHNMLSASHWSPLNLKDLIHNIINAAFEVLPPTQTAEVTLSPSAVQVTPKQAHNLALVINELTTNSVKHAHRPKQTQPLKISVNITQQGQFIDIEFRDNGSGYPNRILAFDERHYSVGFGFIYNVVQHTLQGELTLLNDDGAVTQIRLPYEQ